MSGTYRTLGGETFNLVARQTTGNDLDASLIRRANPGISEPMPPGLTLQIPEVPKAHGVETLDEIEIKIEDKLLGLSPIRIGTADNIELSMAVDAVTKMGFTLPNEPETRDIFTPLGDPGVTMAINGKKVLTGRCDSPKTENAANSKVMMINTYSTPGILETTCPPISAFPLEFKDMPLNLIAQQLCAFHGITTSFEADPGPRFKRVDIQPGENILPFLAGLATQRNLVITSDAEGQLVFWQGGGTGTPVSRLEKGMPEVLNCPTTIDQAYYYSSVTGIMPSKSRKNKMGKQFTVDNPHKTDIVRPYNFEAMDIDEGELETAVEAAAGRMFAGVFTVDLTLTTWEDQSGQLFVPGKLLSLKSEEDFIKNSYDFLIASVTLMKVATSKTANMKLVLPGVYSGEIPQRLPWQ